MTVHLIGAGPGDPDLLTLRAARLLGDADVIVHDRLIGEEIFELAAPWAQRIDVGKNPYGRSTPQEEINAILVDHGRRYQTVVRLKGGDPFVFGRGGEEASALRDAGVDVAVVPGITSAIAAPAAAGIPVTHRDLSSGFTVITAHQHPDNDRDLDWDALARLGTTLVILMGARRARAISERLIAGGLSPDTPVATITSATTVNQATAHTTLDQLGVEPVLNPAVIVIGDVAAAPVLEPTTPSAAFIDGAASRPATTGAPA